MRLHIPTEGAFTLNEAERARTQGALDEAMRGILERRREIDEGYPRMVAALRSGDDATFTSLSRSLGATAEALNDAIRKAVTAQVVLWVGKRLDTVSWHGDGAAYPTLDLRVPHESVPMNALVGSGAVTEEAFAEFYWATSALSVSGDEFLPSDWIHTEDPVDEFFTLTDEEWELDRASANEWLKAQPALGPKPVPRAHDQPSALPGAAKPPPVFPPLDERSGR